MSTKLSCIAVDDEPLALELMVNYIKRTPFLELVGSFNSGVEALSTILENEVDLLFLDIQMPELTGMELSRVIQGNHTKVVFTTAYEHYALDGYKVDAVDYLVKPISYPEFLRAANKVLKLQNPPQSSDVTTAPDNFFVKSNYKLININVADIRYIESVKDYLKIYLESNDQEVQTLMSISTIEKYLPPNTFVRVHRSFIVNMEKVRTIERNRIVFGSVYIPISDTYREQFNRYFDERTIQ